MAFTTLARLKCLYASRAQSHNQMSNPWVEGRIKLFGCTYHTGWGGMVSAPSSWLNSSLTRNRMQPPQEGVRVKTCQSGWNKLNNGF